MGKIPRRRSWRGKEAAGAAPPTPEIGVIRIDRGGGGKSSYISTYADRAGRGTRRRRERERGRGKKVKFNFFPPPLIRGRNFLCKKPSARLLLEGRVGRKCARIASTILLLLSGKLSFRPYILLYIYLVFS